MPACANTDRAGIGGFRSRGWACHVLDRIIGVDSLGLAGNVHGDDGCLVRSLRRTRLSPRTHAGGYAVTPLATHREGLADLRLIDQTAGTDDGPVYRFDGQQYKAGHPRMIQLRRIRTHPRS